MKKCAFLMVSVLVLVSLILLMVSSSHAQTKEEKQFMKQNAKEMTTFMEKCSGCHSLQRVLEDNSLRVSLVAKGAERVKQFSWERCAAQTLDLYQEVCE